MKKLFLTTVISVLIVVGVCSTQAIGQDNSVKAYLAKMNQLSDAEVNDKADELSRSIQSILNFRPQYEQYKNRRAVLHRLLRTLQDEYSAIETSLSQHRSSLTKQIEALQSQSLTPKETAEQRIALLVEDYHTPIKRLMQRESSLKIQIEDLDCRIQDCLAKEQLVQDRLSASKLNTPLGHSFSLDAELPTVWGQAKTRKPQRSETSVAANLQELGIVLDKTGGVK